MGLIRAPDANTKGTARDESGDVGARIRPLLGESASRGGIERLLLAFPRLALKNPDELEREYNGRLTE
ncbi:MAG: hypothetical protein ACT4PZ_22490 [Panacagrimonas sp.]